MSSKRTKARFLGRTIPGAKPAGDMPEYVEMIRPVLVDELPTGADWLHEVKFDGYRMEVHLDRGKVTITSRNPLDWTHRFPVVVQAFKNLPADRVIMDGEVVSLNENGISDFSALQSDLSEGRHDRIAYFAFDLLFFDGFDLTGCTLIQRKKVLKALLDEAKPRRILYSEHFEDGPELYEHAEKLGLEGVVSKKANTTYKPSKSAWRKVKVQQDDDLHIVGFVPSGPRNIAALRLGKQNGATFDYVGKVGTGFTRSVSEQLRKQLDRMVTLKPPLSKRVKKPDTKWVEPHLKARIAFRGITGDGKLRHPSFKGLV